MKTREKYIYFIIIFLLLCNLGMSIYSLSSKSSNKKESYYQDSVDNRLYKTWTNGFSTFKFNSDGTGVRYTENDEKFTWEFTSGTIKIGNKSTNFMLSKDKLLILDGDRGWITFNPSTKENYQESQNYWGYRNEDLKNYCVVSQEAPGQLKFCADQENPTNINPCCDLNNCYVQKDSQFCMVKCKDGTILSRDCSFADFDPDKVCKFFGGTGSPVPLPDNYTCKTIP